MKKNANLYHDDEIDLFNILKIIWFEKIKILLILIISLLIGFGYLYQTPKNYLNSLTIKSSKTVEFLKIYSVQKLLRSNQSNQSNQLDKLDKSKQLDQLNLDRFINELADYEEFLATIKNTKKVQEHFSKLNKDEDQEKELFKYAKLLKIIKPKKNEINYTINFKWHDPDEAKKIFKDTLNLVSKNLKKLTIKELLQTLEFQEKLFLSKDRVRLDFLKEQRDIAKELNIADNKIDNINLFLSSETFNINKEDIAYYLRGYRAIDKEIEIVQNRNYQKLKFIRQEIDNFNKENTEFVAYNVYLTDVKLLKNTKLILVISVLLGLFVGVFYVLVSNAFQSNNTTKKN
jgi:LPS O-antigen subunit length determinant protein (WzzB/FepE family)